MIGKSLVRICKHESYFWVNVVPLGKFMVKVFTGCSFKLSFVLRRLAGSSWLRLAKNQDLSTYVHIELKSRIFVKSLKLRNSDSIWFFENCGEIARILVVKLENSTKSYQELACQFFKLFLKNTTDFFVLAKHLVSVGSHKILD